VLVVIGRLIVGLLYCLIQDKYRTLRENLTSIIFLSVSLLLLRRRESIGL
jgi:hypothetical protein